MAQILAHFDAYNSRRYSKPWACKFEDGRYNFDERVAMYDGKDGDAGNIIILNPIEGQIYAWGQKDYRGGRTELNYSIYECGEFRVLKDKAEAVAISLNL